jgi:SAM-dependent methyltransferase
MPVHEVAERGFGRAAGEYERGRPGYPPAAVASLTRELGLTAGRSVLDVGAGTGKLTRLLPPSGARVLALEPVAGMREQLVAAVPGVELVGGTAEAIQLAGGAVDAVTSATAFHWFETEPALREFHRVLAPRGRLALLWNARDESVDWVAEIAALVSDAVTAASDDATIEHARKLVGLDWRPTLEATGLFEQVAHESVAHVQETDIETQVARFCSISFVSAMPDDARAEFSERLRELLRTHPATRGSELVRFPYVCELYCFRAR